VFENVVHHNDRESSRVEVGAFHRYLHDIQPDTLCEDCPFAGFETPYTPASLGSFEQETACPTPDVQ
jgi:hypothetical protein